MSGRCRSTRPRWPVVCLVPLLLQMAACGPPTIYDAAFEPVREPLLIADLGDGWLAMDSTDAGLRAVLQVEVPVGAEDGEPRLARELGLRCRSRGLDLPVRVRQEPPICEPAPPRRWECLSRFGDPEICRHYSTARTRCYAVVHAEFLFRSVPEPNDSVFLIVGDRPLSAVHWSRY